MDKKKTLPTGTDRSVQEIIDQTYQSKLHEWGKAWKAFGRAWKASRSPLSEFLKKFPVIEEVCQLESWARPEDHTIAARAQRKDVTKDALLRACVPLDVWDKLLKPFSKAGASVKPKMRRLVVQALESWRSDQSFSWQRFANKHCDCGKAAHDIHCKERIRQAAIALQRLLKKLGVELRKDPRTNE
jgi:hypothetical protein